MKFDGTAQAGASGVEAGKEAPTRRAFRGEVRAARVSFSAHPKIPHNLCGALRQLQDPRYLAAMSRLDGSTRDDNLALLLGQYKARLDVLWSVSAELPEGPMKKLLHAIALGQFKTAGLK
tara:strand:- start:8 stop:367 length:360 start_codon:yes stop_codon:yes gene_type:complete